VKTNSPFGATAPSQGFKLPEPLTKSFTIEGGFCEKRKDADARKITKSTLIENLIETPMIIVDNINAKIYKIIHICK
jgi:hypothetical protein